MNYRTYHVSLANEKQYVVHQYPNQKVVQIHKLCENGHTNPNMRAQEKAMLDLSDAAFKLYTYLVWKPHMGLWALSRENTKHTEHIFHKAVDELITKGYLVAGMIQNGDERVTANSYHFYELPYKPADVQKETIVKKREEPQFVLFGAVNRTVNVNNEIVF